MAGFSKSPASVVRPSTEAGLSLRFCYLVGARVSTGVLGASSLFPPDSSSLPPSFSMIRVASAIIPPTAQSGDVVGLVIAQRPDCYD